MPGFVVDSAICNLQSAVLGPALNVIGGPGHVRFPSCLARYLIEDDEEKPRIILATQAAQVCTESAGWARSTRLSASKTQPGHPRLCHHSRKGEIWTNTRVSESICP